MEFEYGKQSIVYIRSSISLNIINYIESKTSLTHSLTHSLTQKVLDDFSSSIGIY